MNNRHTQEFNDEFAASWEGLLIELELCVGNLRFLHLTLREQDGRWVNVRNVSETLTAAQANVGRLCDAFKQKYLEEGRP